MNKREDEHQALERVRAARCKEAKARFLGKHCVAYSVSGEYFLGEGICTAVAPDGLRATLNGTLDIAIIGLRLKM